MLTKTTHPLYSQTTPQIVRSVTRYRDLPSRNVSSQFFEDRPIRSYGIIAFCPHTLRWLLIKRKHSPEMIAFLRGDYTKLELPLLFAGMIADEHRIITKLLNCEYKLRDIYASYLPYLLHLEKDSATQTHAYHKIIEHEEYIRLLLRTTSPKEENEWLWPKGRRNSYERKLICAEREFSEETGVSVRGTLLDSEPLVEKSIAPNGKIYETQLWIWIYDDEVMHAFDDKEEKNHDEVSDASWKSLEDAMNILRESKKLVLWQAWEKIKKNGVLNKIGEKKPLHPPNHPQNQS